MLERFIADLKDFLPMMTETEYLYAWLYYAGGAFIMVVCLWFLVRKMRAPLKTTLLVVAAVMLAVPWYSDAQQTYLSPALIISLFEGFFEGPEAFWRAGMPMLVAMGVSLVLCVIGFTLAWYFRRSDPVPERNIPPSISDIHLD